MIRKSVSFASVGFLILGVLAYASPCSGDQIKAFSLRQADRLVAQGTVDNEQLRNLAGITRFAGMVFDRETSDLILIGKVRDDLPPTSLDDMVVALRSRLLRGNFPKVSIDMTAETPETGLQEVRLVGGIEDTQFGEDFLHSDVVLKRYSLNLLQQVQGLEPYLKLYEHGIRQKLERKGQAIDTVTWLSEQESQKAIDAHRGKETEESKTVQSRFWFYVMEEHSFIVERDDVYVIEELRLGVKEETLVGQETADKSAEKTSEKDEIGKTFAAQFTQRFVDASAEHPVLQRLKALFDLVALAEGIANLGDAGANLRHLITQYPIALVDTPATYPLVQRLGIFKTRDGPSTLVQLSGGIELEAILLALEDGDVSALREAVLLSRPSPDTLSWAVPLDDWQMPNDVTDGGENQSASTTTSQPEGSNKLGFSIGVQEFVLSDKQGIAQLAFDGFPALPPVPPLDQVNPKLTTLASLRPSVPPEHSASGSHGPLPSGDVESPSGESHPQGHPDAEKRPSGLPSRQPPQVFGEDSSSPAILTPIQPPPFPGESDSHVSHAPPTLPPQEIEENHITSATEPPAQSTPFGGGGALEVPQHGVDPLHSQLPPIGPFDTARTDPTHSTSTRFQPGIQPSVRVPQPYRMPSKIPKMPPVPDVNNINLVPNNLVDPNNYNRGPYLFDDIGGVMLSGTATIVGDNDAKVEIANGNFSLVVNGQNARVDSRSFRKFVTALWAVYFSRTDPGISIDPICRPWRAPECKGIDKHLVRYIGKVINTDLGRVMRETDYIMKKWSVGTERPEFDDFRNPDDVAGATRNLTLAASRFWLVPQCLQFKQAGGALLFDQGRMTVQTEYLDDVGGDPAAPIKPVSVSCTPDAPPPRLGREADPANQAFADWFTRRYSDVAERYSVYDDLFDYAKLVALAKYLKSKNVPLYWFLMANKDLVLTEDSPGTVDELAKGSDYFQDVEIRGGVELGATGQYVFDAAAAEAISKLPRNLPTGPTAHRWAESTTQSDGNGPHTPPPGPSEPYSLDVGEKSYTVAPQHTLTSGKDRRGIRYQTDLALRQGGEPGMEVVRYFDPKRREGGEFGQGWRLLIPYRIKPAGQAKRHYLSGVWPERVFIENQVTGAKEILTFSMDRYSTPGWVPALLEESQVVGMFPFSDASYRLVDKLGNEFHFDPSGYLTEVKLSRDHRVFYGYVDTIRDAFEETPYLVRPADEDRVEFKNAHVPQRMQIIDLVNGKRETLAFGDRKGVAGYLPENGTDSRYAFLALLSNASFQLEDRHGNNVVFGADGRFRGMKLADGQRIIERMRQGNQTVEFQYTLSAEGLPIISGAHLVGSRDFVVWYWYNPDGRLARVSRGADRGPEKG